VQQFLKNFLNSIMMHVIHNKGPQSGSAITKPQEEIAYLKFVEDLCRYTFSSPQTYPLILALKTCLHKSFLTQQRYLDAVLSGVKTCVSRLKDNSMSRSVIQDANQDQLENHAIDSSVQAQFDFLSFSVEKLEAKILGKAPIFAEQVAHPPID
jgi:hypothetical protein